MKVNVAELLEKVRKDKPLVHHITNWVTIYDCANITRAFGALPVMAHAKEEVQDMAGIASALVLNIGTLTPQLVEAMLLAAEKANERGIPVVLDVVGAGATPLRTDKVEEILGKVKIDVIKGNAGEIATLAKVKAEVRGVESVSAEGNVNEFAGKLANERNATVVVTGKEDFVSGQENFVVKNGHELLGKVVGTGCMVASVIGAFAAVEKNYAKAAAAALSCFGIAAELAAKEAKGPGSFKENFYDEVYNLSAENINKMQKIEKV